jgi:hypothetical protein
MKLSHPIDIAREPEYIRSDMHTMASSEGGFCSDEETRSFEVTQHDKRKLTESHISNGVGFFLSTILSRLPASLCDKLVVGFRPSSCIQGIGYPDELQLESVGMYGQHL